MASEPDKYLGRDVFTYTQEKERFEKELFQFHIDRRTAYSSLPSVSGKHVDLYRLYLMVTKHGGFHKVCDRNMWYLIPADWFHFPPGCANAELALKQIYMRYLYLYERVFVHGDDPDHPDDEDAGSRGSKSSRILVHQVPMTYNYQLHRIRDGDRVHFGLSTDIAKLNEYERLEKSLLSGLPNEVDFAINVCCVLSMEVPNSMKLFSNRRLIELLMAHVGLFSDTSSLKPLYFEEWFPKTKRNFTQFWYETIEHDEVDFSTTLLDMISCAEHRSQDEAHYMAKRRCLTGYDVLHLGREHSGKDSLLCRVLQVSNIIRNLSFDAANATALAETGVAFNFTMLCCHSTLPQLKTNGMDTLTNLSKKYIMPAIHESSTQLIIRSLHRWIQSNDKLELVNALLTIATLSQVEQNEDIIVESLTQEIYIKIVSLARLCDLQLIVAALDALYFLSEIGEQTCESISLVKHSIDFLTNLITVETQSFGESALGGIIVRDHGVPPHPHHPSHHSQASQSRPVGTMMGPPATPNSRPMSRSNQMMPGQPGHSMPPRPCTPPAPSGLPLPQRPAQHQPQYHPQFQGGSPSARPGLVPTPKHILPATPQNLASMSPEQVATNWLRANYEPYPGTLVYTGKVHTEYVMWLQRRGGPMAQPVTPKVFVSCVKKVFPYSELIPSGVESQLQGIRWKPPQQPAVGPGQVPGQMRPVSTLPPPAYSGPHVITSGNPMTGMPPRISSPSSQTATSDMLRNMLLSEPQNRPRSNSGTSSTVSSGKATRSSKVSQRGRGSRGSSPRSRSIGDSPLPPMSPASSMELQVCGTAEKVENIVNGASLARIERVENTQSIVNSNQKSSTKSSNNIISPGNDLLDNPSCKQNGILSTSEDINSNNPVTKPRGSKGSEGDVSPTLPAPSTNGTVGNVPITPTNTTASSPPLCNGSVNSDNDSLLTAPSSKTIEALLNGDGKHVTRKHDALNGSGDAVPKTFPSSKNGYINGLEKMIASISDDKILKPNSLKQLSDRRRHHSGDSMCSQSSTSTQLSVSQNSQSSDHKQDLPDILSNQHSVPAAPVNQQRASEALTNQQSGKPMPVNPQQASNHIPTVVDAAGSRGATPPLKPGVIVPSHPLNSISVNTAETSSTASKSPLGSPASASKKPTSRKRRKSNASTDSRQSLPESAPQYRCLWESCGSGFTSCSLLRKHVSVSHTSQAGICLWAGCDRVDRKRWALVSHVTEKHTSDAALTKALADREKGILPAPSSSTSQTSNIYTPQASRIAILRNFPKPPFTEFMDIREGPVTKHIRFTAALILRNICRYSPTGRTLLKKHEGQLAMVAGSSMEASSAIVNCLWEIQQAQLGQSL